MDGRCATVRGCVGNVQPCGHARWWWAELELNAYQVEYFSRPSARSPGERSGAMVGLRHFERAFELQVYGPRVTVSDLGEVLADQG